MLYDLKDHIFDLIDKIVDQNAEQLQEELLFARAQTRKARVFLPLHDVMLLKIKANIIKYFLINKLQIK